MANSTPTLSASTSARSWINDVEIPNVFDPIRRPCGVMIVTPANNPPATDASPANRIVWSVACRSCAAPSCSSSRFARQCVGPPVTLALMGTPVQSHRMLRHRPKPVPPPVVTANWQSWRVVHRFPASTTEPSLASGDASLRPEAACLLQHCGKSRPPESAIPWQGWHPIYRAHHQCLLRLRVIWQPIVLTRQSVRPERSARPVLLRGWRRIVAPPVKPVHRHRLLPMTCRLRSLSWTECQP